MKSRNLPLFLGIVSLLVFLNFAPSCYAQTFPANEYDPCVVNYQTVAINSMYDLANRNLAGSQYLQGLVIKYSPQNEKDLYPLVEKLIAFHLNLNRAFNQNAMGNYTNPLVISFECITESVYNNYRPGNLGLLAPSDTKWYEKLYKLVEDSVGVREAAAENTANYPFNWSLAHPSPPAKSSGGAPNGQGNAEGTASIGSSLFDFSTISLDAIYESSCPEPWYTRLESIVSINVGQYNMAPCYIPDASPSGQGAFGLKIRF